MESGKNSRLPMVVMIDDDADEAESMGISKIASCSTCCLGMNGSTAFFLFPTKEGCDIIERDLGLTADYMDGSESYASFLALDCKEEEGLKPAAVAK